MLRDKSFIWFLLSIFWDDVGERIKCYYVKKVIEVVVECLKVIVGEEFDKLWEMLVFLWVMKYYFILVFFGIEDVDFVLLEFLVECYNNVI